MNKKGFTLVELLAVLIVLAILSTIVTTTIIKQVNETQKTLNEAQIDIVKSAAIEYATKKGLFKTKGSIYNICLENLEKEALIDKNIISSLDENKRYYITLTVECDNICSFKASDIQEDENNNIYCN